LSARSLIGLAGTAILVVAAVGAASGCASDPPTQPHDTAPPLLSVLSPTPQSFDADSDGLVDLRIAFSDSGGRVDLASLRVRVINGGAMPWDSNLLAYWRITRVDTAGLEASEVPQALISPGLRRLEISVRDTSGNVGYDTATLTVPELAFHKTLSTGLPVGFTPVEGLAYCPDDRRLYATVNSSLLVIDADSLKMVALVPPTGSTTSILAKPLCIPGDPLLYITEVRMRRFHRPSLSWRSNLSASYESVGLAASRSDPDLIYEGETISGTVGIISRSGLPRRRLLTFPPRNTTIYDVAPLAGDAKLYITYGDIGGVWVLDPVRDSVLARIRFAPPAAPSAGAAQHLVLSADDRRLFVALTYATPGGVAEIDTQADTVVRRLNLEPYLPTSVVLSPDERRLFVTTYNSPADPPSQNVLVNTATLQIVQQLPRPQTPGVFRFDRAALFHPEGRFLFVARDTNVDVYIYRR
jgi:DNA-binding beta-propeller fold protein YncE